MSVYSADKIWVIFAVVAMSVSWYQYYTVAIVQGVTVEKANEGSRSFLVPFFANSCELRIILKAEFSLQILKKNLNFQKSNIIKLSENSF